MCERYFSRVRELSVSRSSSAQSLCTATFEHCQARDDTGLASIRQLEVRPRRLVFRRGAREMKGGYLPPQGGWRAGGLYSEPHFSDRKTKRELCILGLSVFQLTDKAHNNSFILAALRGYLITRSALTSTLGGIVRPICLAAFRLITNSNLVGCSTGRSAGFAPFRILSTYVAARWYKSVKLTP